MHFVHHRVSGRGAEVFGAEPHRPFRENLPNPGLNHRESRRQVCRVQESVFLEKVVERRQRIPGDADQKRPNRVVVQNPLGFDAGGRLIEEILKTGGGGPGGRFFPGAAQVVDPFLKRVPPARRGDGRGAAGDRHRQAAGGSGVQAAGRGDRGRIRRGEGNRERGVSGGQVHRFIAHAGHGHRDRRVRQGPLGGVRIGRGDGLPGRGRAQGQNGGEGQHRQAAGHAVVNPGKTGGGVLGQPEGVADEKFFPEHHLFQGGVVPNKDIQIIIVFVHLRESRRHHHVTDAFLGQQVPKPLGVETAGHQDGGPGAGGAEAVKKVLDEMFVAGLGARVKGFVRGQRKTEFGLRHGDAVFLSGGGEARVEGAELGDALQEGAPIVERQIVVEQFVKKDVVPGKTGRLLLRRGGGETFGHGILETADFVQKRGPGNAVGQQRVGNVFLELRRVRKVHLHARGGGAQGLVVVAETHVVQTKFHAEGHQARQIVFRETSRQSLKEFRPFRLHLFEVDGFFEKNGLAEKRDVRIGVRVHAGAEGRPGGDGFHVVAQGNLLVGVEGPLAFKGFQVRAVNFLLKGGQGAVGGGFEGGHVGPERHRLLVGLHVGQVGPFVFDAPQRCRTGRVQTEVFGPAQHPLVDQKVGGPAEGFRGVHGAELVGQQAAGRPFQTDDGKTRPGLVRLHDFRDVELSFGNVVDVLNQDDHGVGGFIEGPVGGVPKGTRHVEIVDFAEGRDQGPHPGGQGFLIGGAGRHQVGEALGHQVPGAGGNAVDGFLVQQHGVGALEHPGVQGTGFGRSGVGGGGVRDGTGGFLTVLPKIGFHHGHGHRRKGKHRRGGAGDRGFQLFELGFGKRHLFPSGKNLRIALLLCSRRSNIPLSKCKLDVTLQISPIARGNGQRPAIL